MVDGLSVVHLADMVCYYGEVEQPERSYQSRCVCGIGNTAAGGVNIRVERRFAVASPKDGNTRSRQRSFLA